MTRFIKSLADGQLGSTKATLYTAPTSKQAVISRISFANTTTSTVVCKLYFKASGGTSRRIERFELGDEGTAKMEDEITLEAGDIIEGECSVGSVVDYVCSGVENS